ncbi:hypothetical protein CBR_g20047 [Chara braunii]|uniref:Uncharacterized protein n=1 Tax=Chara braunii TaxID=69332 RepID=A0A388KZD0_CHABU|nr:hypothetical protein CBR_g20047 [Chara braunii]|eukprot:GBG75417.1 hypothetical protein CBR_g20047 [Chara braunii]
MSIIGGGGVGSAMSSRGGGRGKGAANQGMEVAAPAKTGRHQVNKKRKVVEGVSVGDGRYIEDEWVREELKNDEDNDFEEQEEEPLKRKLRGKTAWVVQINDGGKETPGQWRGGGGGAGAEAGIILRPQTLVNRRNPPPADVAGSSQVPVQGNAVRSSAHEARGGGVEVTPDAGEGARAGDGGPVGEDDEALVHRLRTPRESSHGMQGAAKLWKDDMRFWNEIQGNAIVKIIQVARAHLVAVVRGVQPPTVQRSITFPHNTIPQHKIEDESELNAVKERAVKVQTIALRAIHRWVFKSESRQRGYHLAYQYALSHAATDIARAMWAGEDWRSLVSPMVFHTTLDMDMNLPLWFVGTDIVDKHEEDEYAAYQEPSVQ